MSEQHINTSLERLVAQSPEDEAQLRRMAAALWHKTGSLMIFSFQKLGWADKEIRDQIGAKLYGRRAAG